MVIQRSWNLKLLGSFETINDLFQRLDSDIIWREFFLSACEGHKYLEITAKDNIRYVLDCDTSPIVNNFEEGSLIFLAHNMLLSKSEIASSDKS